MEPNLAIPVSYMKNYICQGCIYHDSHYTDWNTMMMNLKALWNNYICDLLNFVGIIWCKMISMKRILVLHFNLII